MSDTNAAPSSPEGESTSTPIPHSFDIAPEDAALAESIVNQHPIRDLKGPIDVIGNIEFPEKITRKMLPPEVLARVNARMESVPANLRTEEAEESVILQEVEQYAIGVRVMGGPGPDANDYQQEFYLLNSEVREAESRLEERLVALAEIVRHDRVVDEKGELIDVPVYRMRGDARSAAEHEVSALKHQIALLKGPEGRRRLAEAKWHAVEKAKRMQDELAIDAEAQELAKRQEREDRIADRAAAYRKFRDTER